MSKWRKLVLTACSVAFLGVLQPEAQERHVGANAAPESTKITHVLNRIGFGPSPAALDRVREIGLSAYTAEQLYPERIADKAMAARLEGLTTLTKSTRELADEYFVPALMARRQQQRQAAPGGGATPAPSGTSPESSAGRAPAMRMQRAPISELSQQKVLRAAYSDRQLQEVLVDFWFNHFNVFVGKGPVRMYLTEYDRDAIRPHALGRFRDLLGATARSPAMLFYLDNWQSTAEAGAPTSAPNPPRPVARGRRPQARRMPPDMLPDRPAAQQMRRRGLNENYARELMELHTLGVDGGYTQRDVQEVARAFTGWTIANPRLGGSFRFDPRLHDDGEKMVLGRRIKRGGGQEDGEQVLDLLAAHPSTARFIATKLARRFVADEPPPALVARAAERFRTTNGDIREVVRTIVTSPEFLAPESYRAKVKTPFEFVVSAIRATGMQVSNALPLVQSLRDLGMPLYGSQPPTGYPDRADAWVNTGALLNRMNFAVALAGGRLRLGTTLPGMTASASSADALSERLLETALGGDVSPATASTVAKATSSPQVIALILGSPEFQKK